MSTSASRDLPQPHTTANRAHQIIDVSNSGSHEKTPTAVRYIHRFKDKPAVAAFDKAQEQDASSHIAIEPPDYGELDLMNTESCPEELIEVPKQASASTTLSESSVITSSGQSSTQDVDYGDDSLTSQVTLPTQDTDRLLASAVRNSEESLSSAEHVAEEETASLRRFHLHDADRDNEFKVGDVKAWIASVISDGNC